jgi:hypothetical protein
MTLTELQPIEIRQDSRGVWTVWYQSEASLVQQVPVWDKDGNFSHYVDAGADDTRMVQSYFPGGNREEAAAYAAWLAPRQLAVYVPSKARTPRRPGKRADTGVVAAA